MRRYFVFYGGQSTNYVPQINKFNSYYLSSTVDNVDVLHEHLGVPFPLHFAQSHVHFDLLFRQQPLLHLALETSQQERLKHRMQSLHQLIVAKTLIRVEPLVEVVWWIEHVGQQEIEQRPQFVQVILERRAGQ